MVRLAFVADEVPLCKCGCGERVTWHEKRSRWYAYTPGHHLTSGRPHLQTHLAPLCACGCGKRVTRSGGRNKWPKWLKGHHVRKHGHGTAKERKRNERWLRVYGITVAEYDAMLRAQRGGCAICGTTVVGRRRVHWCIDHDHETGEVRGLLCSLCNTGVGSLGDDPVLLRKAVDYLEGK